jgi:phosphoserine phosphatase RsbU/P
MGGGLRIAKTVTSNLASVLGEVVEELGIASPVRKLKQDIVLCEPVNCDASRVGQVLSNLVANALAHRAADSPVWIVAHCEAGEFEMSVTNLGPTIPPELLKQIFGPFSRGKASLGAHGLGLGLCIPAEIARAHAGGLDSRIVR